MRYGNIWLYKGDRLPASSVTRSTHILWEKGGIFQKGGNLKPNLDVGGGIWWDATPTAELMGGKLGRLPVFV